MVPSLFQQAPKNPTYKTKIQPLTIVLLRIIKYKDNVVLVGRINVRNFLRKR